MKLNSANRRDKKIAKRKYGMRTSGKSTFLIQHCQQKRAEKILKNKADKNG